MKEHKNLLICQFSNNLSLRCSNLVSPLEDFNHFNAALRDDYSANNPPMPRPFYYYQTWFQHSESNPSVWSIADGKYWYRNTGATSGIL